MDSRLHCFIWDVCASSLIPYPVVSPGWRRRFMELSELVQPRHCRAYFPVGSSHAGDLPDSGEWLCYAAQRFPSSGACTLRFHISIARRVGRPDCNQIGHVFLSRFRHYRAHAHHLTATVLEFEAWVML